MSLTLNLYEILRSLLKGDRVLRSLVTEENMEIWIDECGEKYSTELIINFLHPAIASQFQSNFDSFVRATLAIPIDINLLVEGDYVLSWNSEQVLLGKTMNSSMLAEPQQQENNSATMMIGDSDRMVDSNDLKEPMRSSLIQVIAQEKMLVCPKMDGGFTIPLTTFYAAWQRMGEMVISGSINMDFNGSAPQANAVSPTPKAQPKEAKSNGNNNKPKAEKQTAPKLFLKQFTAGDLAQTKQVSLKNFLAKINGKVLSVEDAIAQLASNEGEYAERLFDALHRAHKIKSPNMRPNRWDEMVVQYMAIAKDMVHAPVEAATEAAA